MENSSEKTTKDEGKTQSLSQVLHQALILKSCSQIFECIKIQQYPQKTVKSVLDDFEKFSHTKKKNFKELWYRRHKFQNDPF